MSTSVTPRGMSVQEAYRIYRDGNFLVNRRYQRKLVWTSDEKKYLVDSALKGLPIPLILLAERPKEYGSGKYEVIDGVQRLNALFSYIENAFEYDGVFFDVNQLLRAKQAAEEGLFEIQAGKKLGVKECANILDYQLAVTVFPATEEAQITDVFRRINAGGKQLSPQETRQAGVTDPLADLVRRLATEIRGDASKEILALSEMPEISVDSKRADLGYGLKAEETFWCKQGVLTVPQLRDSEDEELVADIACSILLGSPFPRSKEAFDELYAEGSDLHKRAESALAAYTADRLSGEVKATLSVIKQTIESQSVAPNYMRSVVNPGAANPIKASFYAIFMAFHDLVVKEEKSPADNVAIMKAVVGLQQDMIRTANYSKPEDRAKNIDKTKGLIQKYFVKKEPPVLRHGPGLALDFENSLRRSKSETARYECKQGIVDLSSTKRTISEPLLIQLVETACAIANLGPTSEGFIFIGVADKKTDAERVQALDKVAYQTVGHRYVVGIDREISFVGKKIDDYVGKLIATIKSSTLSEPLRQQLATQIDVVDFRGLSVIRLKIPSQKDVSFVGSDCFVREGAATIKVQSAPGVNALSKMFK